MFLLPVRDKSKGSLASKEIPCKGFVKYSTLYRCSHLASIENRNRGRLPKGGINTTRTQGRYMCQYEIVDIDTHPYDTRGLY